VKAGHLLPLRDGDAEDALTRARRIYFWQRGEIRRIKRRQAKRERRHGRAEAQAQAREHLPRSQP